MSQSEPISGPGIEVIFHPSDFSADSEIAFVHALKLALATGARLDMLHVSGDHSAEWGDFPGVRETLERWGLIPEGSPRRAVTDLGIDIKKAIVDADDPVRGCLDYVAQHPVDLIVLSVGSHEGRMRWFNKSVGEPIARSVGEMTLFLPHGVPGFVSRVDGHVRLQEILIPVANKPGPQASVDAVAGLIRQLKLPAGHVTLLHVGAEIDMPPCRIPAGTGWTWTPVVDSGNAASAIVRQAARRNAGLIVMTTDGPDGFLDGLRGTTSERVLHQAPCAVAILPVGPMAGLQN